MKYEPLRSDVKCQKCQSYYPHDYWMDVDADENPEIKDQIISGELFRFRCPRCGTVTQLVFPCLYEDSSHKVIIEYTNMYDADERVEVLIKNPETRKEGYQYRIVEDIDDFREKVMIFSCGLDDRVIELEKNHLLNQFHYGKPEEAVQLIRFDFEVGYPWAVRGVTVYHRLFGEGVVSSVNDRRISVQFAKRARSFMYPESIKNGTLSRTSDFLRDTEQVVSGFKMVIIGNYIYTVPFSMDYYKNKLNIMHQCNKGHNWSSDYVVDREWVKAFWQECED